MSIFNFHYASPPETVAMNYGLNKVIGDDETGFRGVSDDVYRMEGWEFVIAGGGLYNNLDYSFAAGHEDGTFEYPASQPGGGSRALRRQLKILARVHRRLRFSADGAGQRGHHGRRAAWRQRAGAGRTRPGDGDLPAEETRGADRRKRSRLRLTLDRQDRCESISPRASGAPNGSTR